jgi:hypothetical protein
MQDYESGMLRLSGREKSVGVYKYALILQVFVMKKEKSSEKRRIKI